jgi:hypothetical protein
MTPIYTMGLDARSPNTALPGLSDSTRMDAANVEPSVASSGIVFGTQEAPSRVANATVQMTREEHSLGRFTRPLLDAIAVRAPRPSSQNLVGIK